MCFPNRFRLMSVSFFLVILGVWQSIRAEEPTNQAAEKFRSDMIAARKDYDQAVANASAEYVKSLKVALTDKMQHNDLDAAVFIREQIKWLEKEHKTGNVIMDKLAGTTWVNANKVTWEWKKDGSLFHNGQQVLCIPIDAKRVVVIFKNNWVQQFIFDDNYQKFEQWAWGNNGTPMDTANQIKLSH